MQKPEQAVRTLVVDDDLGLRTVISSVLSDDGLEVTEAESGEEALEIFKQEPFPLVFTDIVMGQMSGIELLRELKQLEPDTRVITMTSHATLDTAVNALRAGAYDYLFKPFEDFELISAVASRALESLTLIAENKRLLVELREKNRHLEEVNQTLKEMTIRDGLTGLFNHRHFQESLSLEIFRAQRHAQYFSLIFLDVDNFKIYNDTHGHPKGDEALQTLAALIKGQTRRTDLVARYGGEEFVVLLPETSKEQALVRAENIRQAVQNHSFAGATNQPQGRFTISLGVATYPEDGKDGSTLTKLADKALYTAKGQGRNRVCAWGTGQAYAGALSPWPAP